MPSRNISPRSEPETAAISGQVTGVRLPPPMRDQLMREAVGNHRSLSQEIIQRLAVSLEEQQSGVAAHIRPVGGGSGYRAEDGNALPPLSQAEHALLNHFAQLSAEKQLALLTFLKKG